MIRFALTLFLLTQCLTASPSEWLYAKPCVYNDFHDGGIVDLEGYGRIYIDSVAHGASFDDDVKLYPDALKFADMIKWQAGKEVRIAFSSETGAVLLDPTTGRYCEIISGLDVHPLDALHKEYMGEGSTASVVVGTQEAKELWIQEIKRVYNRLRYEFPEHVAQIDEAEANWETFYAAQLKVIGIANDKQGSLYSMSAAEERLKLVRDHALGLARWGRY